MQQNCRYNLLQQYYTQVFIYIYVYFFVHSLIHQITYTRNTDKMHKPYKLTIIQNFEK